MTTMCACGKPLHYEDPANYAYVKRQIAILGEYIPVQVLGTTVEYLVPRHYIALHGLKAADLPGLALQYNFQQRLCNREGM